MAATVQRTALTCFLIVPLALIWAWHHLKIDSVWMPSLAICILSAPGFFLLVEFLLLRHYQDRLPITQLGPTGLIRLWANEALVAAKSFFWDQALREQRFPSVYTGKNSMRGVVLVHGYLCNRGFWNPWIPRLRAADQTYVCVSLHPVFGSIDDSANQIESAVRRCTEMTGAPPVLVTHSMGGLSVRAAMRCFGDRIRVHHVVTIACPHGGTELARWGLHQKEQQMRRGSAWLGELARSESQEMRAKFTCFYSDCDNVVFPTDCAQLPGANNRLIKQRAHLQLAASPEVFEEVLRRMNR
jgi:pimeloyl-ACP methyl ester carboxylesterase